MRKMIISDFDGTLKTTEEELLKNIEKIKKFRSESNFFCIATGRSYESFKKIIDKYNIEYDYLILGHGTIVLDKENNTIKKYTIEKETAKQLLEEIEKNYNVTGIKLYDLYKQNHNIEENQITKIRIINNNYDQMQIIKNFINTNYKYNTYLINDKKNIFVDIINSNKSLAIKELSKILHIKQIYTIGNDVNDIEMILEFNGFRMENSEKELMGKTNKFYNQVSQLIRDVIENNI